MHTEEQAEQFEAAVEYYLDIFNCDKTKKGKDQKFFSNNLKNNTREKFSSFNGREKD